MPATDATLVASSAVAVSATYPPQGVASTLANARISQIANVTVTSMTFGTASGLVDLITCSDRTYTAAGGATPSVTYDLFTGTDLKDLDGQTCAFRKVKFIQVSIVSGGDAAGIRIGGAAADAWTAFFSAITHKALIFPSGPAYVGGSPAGVAVGTLTKNLFIENLSAVAVTVRILIAGSSV